MYVMMELNALFLFKFIFREIGCSQEIGIVENNTLENLWGKEGFVSVHFKGVKRVGMVGGMTERLDGKSWREEIFSSLFLFLKS